MQKLLIVLCFLLLLPGCVAAPRQAASFDIIVAADLHYISPALTDGGAAYTDLIENGDGKYMQEGEELTDAFLGEVIMRRPEALLLLGDLTFNGAMESHRALAEKLKRVEDAGIPVLVTTGNHDLNNPSAAAFFGESARRVPSADTESFRTIYADFGYDEALSRDRDSLSYVYLLNSTTRILMLDSNTPAHPCGLSESTLRWIRDELKAARRAGQQVIAAGHQNLLQQTLFLEGYVLERADELLALFVRYKVPIYLSGHLHAQLWRTERGVTEIATSALSVFPCQVGLLRAKDGRMVYETRETDVDAWTAARGRREAEMPGFPERAAAVFDACAQRQLPEVLASFGYSTEEISRMTKSFCALNRSYFSGDLRAAALDYAPDAELWDAEPGLYGLYVRSMREDFGRDFRRWESALPPA